MPGGGFCAPTELPAARGEAWRGGCAPVLCSWGSPPAPSAWQVPCPGHCLSFKAAWKCFKIDYEQVTCAVSGIVQD